MAYLVQRRDGRVEIREAVSTARGPRSRTLASFRGALSPEVLQRAARRAGRPFNPEPLIARAGALGVPVTDRPQNRVARELIARLRRGEPIDPVLVTILNEALAAVPAAPVPAALGEVVDVRRRKPAMAARSEHERNLPLIGPTPERGPVNVEQIGRFAEREPARFFGIRARHRFIVYMSENLQKTTETPNTI